MNEEIAAVRLGKIRPIGTDYEKMGRKIDLTPFSVRRPLSIVTIRRSPSY
jgi:hypothetical protein